jgi:hypothetical protein
VFETGLGAERNQPEAQEGKGDHDGLDGAAAEGTEHSLW